MADLNLLTKMNKYEWKMRSLAKGIDPEEAIAEIERIENLYGSLTAENVLKAAQPEDSLFHCLFQWDDSKAAHQFRLQQARNIINNIEVKVVSDGGERSIPVFEIVNLGEGRVYKSIQSMDKDDVEYVKQSVKREISYLRSKLSTYNSFEATIKHLDNALETL
jgi:hypothetical protein